MLTGAVLHPVMLSYQLTASKSIPLWKRWMGEAYRCWRSLDLYAWVPRRDTVFLHPYLPELSPTDPPHTTKEVRDMDRLMDSRYARSSQQQLECRKASVDTQAMWLQRQCSWTFISQRCTQVQITGIQAEWLNQRDISSSHKTEVQKQAISMTVSITSDVKARLSHPSCKEAGRVGENFVMSDLGQPEFGCRGRR